jgi:S1-C subfamily serine protease
MIRLLLCTRWIRILAVCSLFWVSGRFPYAMAATRSALVQATSFYAATDQSCQAWQNRGTRPAPVSRFPAGTTKVCFYIAWSGANISSDTFQVRIYNAHTGAVYTTGAIFTAKYVDGITVRRFQGGVWQNGMYRADLMYDPVPSMHLIGLSLSSTLFTVGPLPLPTCLAHTVQSAGTCARDSVLRLDGLFVHGTAFVIRSDSSGTYLLTNKHLVEHAMAASLQVVAASGVRYPVQAIHLAAGRDGTAADLAVLVLAPSPLRPLPWATAGSVRPGEQVATVGFGGAARMQVEPTVVLGTIDATNVDVGDNYGHVWIQVHAPIDDTFAGSPLVDTQGAVVGIATIDLLDLPDTLFAVSASRAASASRDLE